MKTKAILVTGALGEVGYSLLKVLPQQTSSSIVALDLQAASGVSNNGNEASTQQVLIQQGDIIDKDFLANLFSRYHFTTIFHLAGMLSTSAEKNPLYAHQVNVGGSLNLLELAQQQSQEFSQSTCFILPSTIAVYGIPSSGTKLQAGKIKEDQYLDPVGMYGINKLHVEKLGIYFQKHFKYFSSSQLRIDFRCVRLPGVLSADTIPTGGTSDYGPEMLHHAAQDKPYACFVKPETKLPFVAMPDVVGCLLKLMQVPLSQIKQSVYNITSFSVSAEDLRNITMKHFPQANITYALDSGRNALVETWPGDVDDTPARRDWGWSPKWDFENTFSGYLIPAVKAHYKPPQKQSCSCVNS